MSGMMASRSCTDKLEAGFGGQHVCIMVHLHLVHDEAVRMSKFTGEVTIHPDNI